MVIPTIPYLGRTDLELIQKMVPESSQERGEKPLDRVGENTLISYIFSPPHRQLIGRLPDISGFPLLVTISLSLDISECFLASSPLGLLPWLSLVPLKLKLRMEERQ